MREGYWEFTASYHIPEGANAAPGYDIMEMDIAPAMR